MQHDIDVAASMGRDVHWDQAIDASFIINMRAAQPNPVFTILMSLKLQTLVEKLTFLEPEENSKLLIRKQNWILVKSMFLFSHGLCLHVFEKGCFQTLLICKCTSYPLKTLLLK